MNYIVVKVDGDTLTIKPKGAPDSESFEIEKSECKPAALEELKELRDCLRLLLGKDENKQ